MAENDPTPEIDPTPGLDQGPTTIQVRKWIIGDVVAIRALLRDHNTIVRRVLPSDMAALADKLMDDGRPWPQWLIVGLGVRLMLRSMQSALRAADMAGSKPVPTALAEALVIEPPKPKRGAR